MNQNPVDIYQAPEIVEPTIPETTIPEPETQPIYEPEEDDLNIPAAVPAVNTASQSANNPATAPKFGEAGSKALDEILRDVSEYYKEERSKALTDAYNAGLNGLDITQEIRADAAVGGYLEQIEAMYNAGQADARARTDTAATSSANSNQTGVDNTENLGYTASNTTRNTGMETVEPVKYTDTSRTYGASNTSSANNGTSSNPSADSYDISDSEKELNYMMDMLFMNGAASSAIPSVRMAYEWVSNPDNKGKEIPKEVYDAFYAFMGGISDHQIAKSNHSAVGKDDELGFVKDIYEAKKENQQKSSGLTDAETKKMLLKFYYLPGKPSPLTTYDLKKLYEYLNISLGKAGQTVLGEIIKPDPEAYGNRSGILMEAYKAGLMGYDFSKESINIARGEGYLGDVLKIYQAGETDKKMAEEKAELDDPKDNTDLTTWKADNNYYKSMLDSLGADINDKNIKKMYDYFNNSDNKGEEIPKDIKDAFYSYLRSIDKDERIRVYEAATGKDLKGLYEGDIIPTGPYKNCKVTQGFNDPNTDLQGHIGYDIGGDFKDIYPILDGVIVAIQPEGIKLDENGNYKLDKDNNPIKSSDGVTITIRHTNAQGQVFYSTYCHLKLDSINPEIANYFKENHYKKGLEWRITTDTKIAEKGNTGTVDEHLHLCVYTGGATSNPEGYCNDDNEPFSNFSGYIAYHYILK